MFQCRVVVTYWHVSNTNHTFNQKCRCCKLWNTDIACTRVTIEYNHMSVSDTRNTFDQKCQWYKWSYYWCQYTY